jgi:hypothetical protein
LQKLNEKRTESMLKDMLENLFENMLENMGWRDESRAMPKLGSKKSAGRAVIGP